MKENDIKIRERRRKIIRFFGYVVAIISGICLLLMTLADDFSLEALVLFGMGLLMIIFTKKDGDETNNER